MFGGKQEGRQIGKPGLSVIGADVSVSGDITTPGDLHVDGTVTGDIACGALVQGATGRIVGTVRARAARIAGAVEGTIDAQARIRGDSTYDMLTIATGAQVDGRMTHRGGDAAEAPLRLVDATDAPS